VVKHRSQTVESVCIGTDTQYGSAAKITGTHWCLNHFQLKEIETVFFGEELMQQSRIQTDSRNQTNDSLFKDARGLDVCFGYNNARGCRRTAVDATTCRDPISQIQYAHFCSNWDPAANAHCLRTHPRCGNH
jgi:hypothetical protein